MSTEPTPNKPKRKRPGSSQERRIWDESGSRCQFCGRIGVSSLQIHHLDENSANTVDFNLIAICGSCHEEYKHGIISQNDAYKLKKRLIDGELPFPVVAAKKASRPRTSKKTSISVDSNYGQVAENITNNNYGPQKGKIILEESIASSLHEYNYTEYLIKRLASFREKGSSYGQKRSSKVHPGVVRNMIESEFGALPKDLSLEKWEPLSRWLKAKIDKTALGRNNAKKGYRNYSTFEEFIQKGE